MGPDNYDQPYVDDDLRYGQMMGRLLNPPPEDGAQPAQQAAAAPVRAAATPSPAPVATPTPSAPTPVAVTPNGKSRWGDIVRQSETAAQTALQQSQQASDAIRSQPSVTEASQPIQANIQRDSTPTPYRDPQTGKVLDSAQQFKPGMGSRIMRGVRSGLIGFATGGIPGALVGAIEPQDIAGGKGYAAPNRAYDTTEQQRQSRLTTEQQQLANMLAANKEDTDRLGKIGSETRATATGYGDVAKAATAQQNAESGTRGQSAVLQKAASAGLKPVMDENGNVTAWEDDPNSEAFKTRAVMSDLRQAQREKAEADTALSRAKNDPNSPAFRQAEERARTASANASAAQVRASAYMLNATAGNLGVDTQGNQIEGGATTADGKPIGSRFASPYIKQEGKTAQFNDVLGATDQLENTARALVKSGGKLNDPVIAAGIAQPQGTFGQWVQGQVANGNMTAAQRDYVTNMRAFRENLQALRQSAGGGVSDAQVNRLMEMAPGANTPDIDFLLRQTGQIRNTAGRLSEGLPKMKGGHEVRTNANAPSSDMPPDSVVQGMKEGQYVHGPGGSYRKVNGKLVKQ